MYACGIVGSSLTQAALVRHSAWTLLQQMAATLVSLCTTVLLARLLGPSGQGLYGVITTTAMLCGMCVNLGTPAATTYQVSRRQVSVSQALDYTFVITLVLGGAGALLMGLLTFFCADTLWPAVPRSYLCWAAALMPALLASQLLAGILQGAQAFSRYNKMALVAPVVTGITSLVALHAGGGPGTALASLLFGLLCAVAWGVFSVRQLATEPEQACAPLAPPSHWWRYFYGLLGFGFMAALANALAYGSYRIDVFLLNAWLPRERVGYYSVAASVAERLWMLSGAVNMVLFAQVARNHAPKQKTSSGESTAMLVRHVLWLVMFAALALYLAAPTVLPLLFGARYIQAVPPLRALLPGVVVFNVARIISQDLAGRGLVRINVGVGAVCLAINVVGNVLLIPRLGVTGAAWASTLSYSADTLCKLVLYTQLTGTRWTQLLWLQPEDWRRMGSWLQTIRTRLF
jgi:O-antigen/teichoic acid export membrane protein